MGWASRRLGVSVIGLSMGLSSGCLGTLPDWAAPRGSLAPEITDTSPPSAIRFQAPPAAIQPPPPLNPDTIIAPPPQLPEHGRVVQASLATRGTVRVSVRAWVNGRPIFDDEVMHAIGSEMNRLKSMPEALRAEKFLEMRETALDQLIDSEVMYQDAVKKISQSQAHMLDKLKEYVGQEYDKKLAAWRKAGMPEGTIREIEPVVRRTLERNLISMEYARSRIKTTIDPRVGLQEVRDYYDAHKNEFQTVDKVAWRDIFIPSGSANLPNPEDVKRFAEGLLKKQAPADFDRLMTYNEGDSKLRNGYGLGQLRGDIRPRELEETLFQMKEGAVSVIPVPHGAHIVRVEKREYKGQMPLDELTHKTIRRKLENQLAEREIKRIVRELRSRAVIYIEKDRP